jgi:hypothetical protein
LMVLETVAVETLARLAISRMSINSHEPNWGLAPLIL